MHKQAGFHKEKKNAGKVENYIANTRPLSICGASFWRRRSNPVWSPGEAVKDVPFENFPIERRPIRASNTSPRFAFPAPEGRTKFDNPKKKKKMGTIK